MYKQHQISRMFMCRCCNWAFPDKTSLHMHMQVCYLCLLPVQNLALRLSVIGLLKYNSTLSSTKCIYETTVYTYFRQKKKVKIFPCLWLAKVIRHCKHHQPPLARRWMDPAIRLLHFTFHNLEHLDIIHLLHFNYTRWLVCQLISHWRLPIQTVLFSSLAKVATVVNIIENIDRNVLYNTTFFYRRQSIFVTRNLT